MQVHHPQPLLYLSQHQPLVHNPQAQPGMIGPSQQQICQQGPSEKQRDIELLGKEIGDSLDQLMNQKQALITNVWKAIEAEEEYYRNIAQVHPDQVYDINKAIVEELLPKKDDEKKELKELEQETNNVQELGQRKLM